MKQVFSEYVLEKRATTIDKLSDKDIYYLLLSYVKEQALKKKEPNTKKKVYYISAEFLIGKLLSNNLINLGIYEEVEEELKKYGKKLNIIEDIELEPSLGNGGLGRLAACFIDSISTLGINGSGIGLNYHCGLFKQVFKNNEQAAEPNFWIENESWLIDTDVEYTVEYKHFNLKSSLKKIDVLGYNKETKNYLNLFDLKTVDSAIIKSGIDFDKKDIPKNLTLFLYPDDSDKNGELLRIYQQYFMISNAAQLIIDEAKEKGSNIHDLPEYAYIQINDTHPSLIIPEMIRLLQENHNILFEEAVKITSEMVGYTNHTILAEALEKWPVEYLEEVVPKLVVIIKKLDKIIRKKYENQENIQIIDKSNKVHMAHMDIHFSNSVNGVAYLHTEILKNSELNHFYKLYPEKFNNKTNGITFRRWLEYTNKPLAKYLKKLIGDEYLIDSTKLEKLLNYYEEKEVIENLERIKHENKLELKNYLKATQGIDIDENSIIDTQIKRFHEYKRQQMNALYVIKKYFDIKSGKIPKRKITIIFGGKAAPAYIIAQDIIHLILCLSELINNDPEVSPYLAVHLVENYNVTLAEKLIPATDISEQISLASKEASGTGNMKFMLNGALTLGTLDGANVEIAELVGEDNIYIFGKHSEEIIKLYETAGYFSKKYYNKPFIKEIVDFIISEELLKIGNKERLNRLYKELLNKDWFMTLIDLEEYYITKERMLNDYEDRESWQKKALVNIAKSGFFSSDRTIKQYNEDIWNKK